MNIENALIKLNNEKNTKQEISSGIKRLEKAVY